MKEFRAKQTGLQKRSLYTITDLQTCPYYIIVWNRRQKESCSTDPVLRITPYLICHVLCLEQDGCSTSPLNIELMRFELKLQPHVVGGCTVCSLYSSNVGRQQPGRGASFPYEKPALSLPTGFTVSSASRTCDAQRGRAGVQLVLH